MQLIKPRGSHRGCDRRSGVGGEWTAEGRPLPIAEQPGGELPREEPLVEESSAPSSSQPEELLHEVRYVRRGPTTESIESSSSRSSTRDAMDRDARQLGYENRFWSQGARGHVGHDGLTFRERERERWQRTRGPDHPEHEQVAPDPNEVPVWMGISSQMPVNGPGRTEPWREERRFGMTSQLQLRREL